MGNTNTSGMAITSLIIGIIGLFIFWIPIIGFLVMLAGLIIGIVALVKVNNSSELKGRGLAIAGIIINGLLILLSGIMLIGAVAYFGVLTPTNLVPDSCSATNGISCLEYAASENTIGMRLVNTLDAMDITSANDISATISSGACTVNTISSDKTGVIATGDAITLSIDCAKSIPSNERIQGQVAIAYTPVGKDMGQTATIDFTVKAQ